MSVPIVLNGTNLGIYRLVRYSRGREFRFDLSEESKTRIADARQVVEKAAAGGEAVYGLTTGLGAKVTHRLSDEEQSTFSYQVLRGRGHSLGEPMPVEIIRGAMIARLNSLAIGVSGASPHIGEFIRECLNRHLAPVVGCRGSIGASDLCWGATMGLAFIGEGRMYDARHHIVPARDALRIAGLRPLDLGPKDGLVLANHSGFSATLSAFAVYEASVLMDAVQAATAMTLQAFRANPSPIDPFVAGLSGQDGVIEAAGRLRQLLGSESVDSDRARSVQDPLSIRNAVQVHGAALSAVKFARETVNAELNASSDSPVVDVKKQAIVSSGGFYAAHLTVAVETVSRSVLQLAVTQLARMEKLLSQRFSGLPQFLASPGANSNGFAPIMKLAESTLAEIKMLTAPVGHWPGVNADGMEDIQPHSPLAAQSLRKALARCRHLAAMEMMFASQALELSGQLDPSSSAIAELYSAVREVVPRLGNDRPMGGEIEVLAQKIERAEIPHVGK
ncbi:MAG: aromatic amino acid ammonia-lyase [Gammaproteobacteria bacterium]|nr:aromatic amino acid ammonia-lyase [Gammaproteobacteria bacterium]